MNIDLGDKKSIRKEIDSARHFLDRFDVLRFLETD